MKLKDRNKCVECGPIYCEGCGKFFDDKKRTNIANYWSVTGDACKQHEGKIGYSLLERLDREELQTRV